MMLGRMNTSRFFFWREPLRDLNRLPMIGNGAESRHPILAFGHGVRHQAAEHDDAAVLDQHGGLDRALVGGNVGRIGQLRAGRGVFLLDLELHRIAFVDVRRDLQNRAHFLALNRLETDWWFRLTLAVVLAIGAGDQRDLLRDLHLRLFIVHRDHGRRGDDVAGAVAAQRLHDRRKAHAVVVTRPTATVAPVPTVELVIVGMAGRRARSPDRARAGAQYGRPGRRCWCRRRAN